MALHAYKRTFRECTFSRTYRSSNLQVVVDPFWISGITLW